MSNEEYIDRTSKANESSIDSGNWVDADNPPRMISNQPKSKVRGENKKNTTDTVVIVETAFLASTASLIWLINYYFPFGPLLRLFFPIPIALVYLRRGTRASVMSALTATLLLSVLMGPTRSIVFLIPFGLMGILLGHCWQRNLNWSWSIILGSLIGSVGLLFRFWLFSILLGEDLWVYVITQITQLTDWLFLKLGILAEPSFFLIQILALLTITINNLVYLFAVHLISLMLFDRLSNPIPRPPQWVRVLLDY